MSDIEPILARLADELTSPSVPARPADRSDPIDSAGSGGDPSTPARWADPGGTAGTAGGPADRADSADSADRAGEAFGASRFDPDELWARARRRTRRRRAATAVAAAAAMVVVAAGGVALFSRAGGLDDGLRTDAVTQPDTDRADDADSPDDGDTSGSTVPETTANPTDPTGSTLHPHPSQVDIEPDVALQLMNIVDEFLALLASDRPEAAVDLWAPARTGALSVEEAAAQLDDHCGGGRCRYDHQILAARRLVDEESERYEVLVEADTDRTPFALALTPAPNRGDATTPWAISGLPPPGSPEEAVAPWADRLFESFGARPERVIVARSSRFEISDDGLGSRFTVGQGGGGAGRLFDLWVEDGWLNQEGGWVRIDDPTERCDYGSPPGRASVLPISIFEHDGRWITEVVELWGEADRSTARMGWWWDCAAGTEVALPDLSHSVITLEGGQVALVSDGSWIIHASGADGSSELRRPDGSLITDEPADLPVFDGETATVAYVSLDEPQDRPATNRTVVVRSVETGEEVGRWLLATQVTHLDFDGRFLVAIDGPADYRPVSSPWDLDRRLFIVDTRTGATSAVITPVAQIWID